MTPYLQAIIADPKLAAALHVVASTFSLHGFDADQTKQYLEALEALQQFHEEFYSFLS